MSHSICRPAPLLHRLMRRRLPAMKGRPLLGLAEHAAKLKAFGGAPGLLGVCTQSQGGAVADARTLCTPVVLR